MKNNWKWDSDACNERRMYRIKGTMIIIGAAIVATFIIATLS